MDSQQIVPNGETVENATSPKLETKMAEQKAERLVLPILEEGGYDLVRVLLSGKGHLTLQVMIERKDRAGMGIDDCVWVTHRLLESLEADDITEQNYELEVTSPGIERPLMHPSDYVRFVGEYAMITVHDILYGKKKISGFLQPSEGDNITILTDQGPETLLFTDIISAHLAIRKQRKKGKRN